MTNLGVYRDRLAESGLRVFEYAIKESRHRQQNYVSFGHILKALMAENAAFFDTFLHNLKIDPPLTEEFIEKLIESSPDYAGKGIRISPQIIWLFRQAMSVARADGREKIEAADLLLSFMQGIKAGAPWVGSDLAGRVGIAFLRVNPPHFFVVQP